MALTEKEFSVIKKEMDKIDQRLDDLYNNWHAEYGNTNILEECKEIQRFYKPYLENTSPNIESCIIYYSNPA